MKQLTLVTDASEWLAGRTTRRQQRLYDQAVQEVEHARSEWDMWNRLFVEAVQLYHYDGNTRTPLMPQGKKMSCTEIKAAIVRSHQQYRDANHRYENVCDKLRHAGWTID